MKKVLASILVLCLVVMTGSFVALAEGAQQHADLKIAMLSDPVGTEKFLLQALDALKASSEANGFQYTSIECPDVASWEENTRGAAEDGYNLIVGVSWRAAEPFSALAEEFPNTKFAVIDTNAQNEAVKSISFNMVEGTYVLGAMVGTAFPDEKLFGYVCNFQDQASYEYRYGFSQGVLSVNPNAEFMYNYANSYSDTSVVYEYTMQQRAAGCTFIFGGVASSANFGIYQAALELGEKGTPIYTTGLSVDQTTEENPYIIGGLLKDTGVCMTSVVDEFLAGNFTGGNQVAGIEDGACGVVGITTDSFIFRNADIMTDAVLEAGRAARAQIVSGEVTVVAPQE